MKTSAASIRDSWAYQRWGAKGARAYLNVVFAALEVQVLLLLAGFVYFTFVDPIMPPLLFTLACCLFLLAVLKLIGIHRTSLLEVKEAESGLRTNSPATL